MKRFFAGIVSIMLTIGVGTVVLSTPAFALGEGGVTRGINDARGDGVPTNLTNGDSSLVKKIINIMLYFIGILAVVAAVFGVSFVSLACGCLLQDIIPHAIITTANALKVLFIFIFLLIFIRCKQWVCSAIFLNKPC